jgi:hypothetical protein
MKFTRIKQITEIAAKYNADLASLSEDARNRLMKKLEDEDLLHIASYLASEPQYKNTREVASNIKYVAYLAHWMCYDDNCDWITFTDYLAIEEFAISRKDVPQAPKPKSVPGTKFSKIAEADANPHLPAPESWSQYIGESPALRMNPTTQEPDLGGGFNQHMWKRGQK